MEKGTDKRPIKTKQKFSREEKKQNEPKSAKTEEKGKKRKKKGGQKSEKEDKKKRTKMGQKEKTSFRVYFYPEQSAAPIV